MADRHRIVVALELTEYAETILEHALDIAARHDASDLHFLTVASPADPDIDDGQRALFALVMPALEDLGMVDWRAHIHVRVGDAPEEIASFAAEIEAHLLVIGRFGTYRPRRSIGATASKVIELATCPTLVIGLPDHAPAARRCCAACVDMRAANEGERWFCATHATPDRMRLSRRIGLH
jgi:nucleotide-binding universal stress UspA family protein